MLEILKTREKCSVAAPPVGCTVGSLTVRYPGTLRLRTSIGFVPRRASPFSSNCTNTDLLVCCVVRRQALPDDAERPAAAIVLGADHALQRLAVDQRIVPAPDQRPVADRPLPREVDLLQLRDTPVWGRPAGGCSGSSR